MPSPHESGELVGECGTYRGCETDAEYVLASSYVVISKELLKRWIERVKRCDSGGFPTNVKLEMELFLDENG